MVSQEHRERKDHRDTRYVLTQRKNNILISEAQLRDNCVIEGHYYSNFFNFWLKEC